MRDNSMRPGELERLPTRAELKGQIRKSAFGSPAFWMSMAVGAVGAIAIFALGWFAAFLQFLFSGLAIGAFGVGIVLLLYRMLLADSIAERQLNSLRPEYEELIRQQENDTIRLMRERLHKGFLDIKGDIGRKGITELNQLSSAYRNMWDALDEQESIGYFDTLSVPRLKLTTRASYKRGLEMLLAALNRMQVFESINVEALRQEAKSLANQIPELEKDQSEVGKRKLKLQQDQLSDVEERIGNIANLELQIAECLRTSNEVEKALEDSLIKLGDVHTAASENTLSTLLDDMTRVITQAQRVQEVMQAVSLEA